MKVTREVILDLLPLYLAGEGSPATRALVEEYLKNDSELAERVRTLGVHALEVAATKLGPDLELDALRRTRRRLGQLRWLLGMGLAFTALALAMEMRFH